MENKVLQSKGHYINGLWNTGAGSSFTSLNPAKAELVWQGQKATPQEVNAAYEAALSALPTWSSQSVQHRVEILHHFARTVEKYSSTLAQLISQETGKPLWEAKTEVASVINKVNISLKAYEERSGEKQESSSDATLRLRFKPHGVVVVLGAFNFPAHLGNGHIVPALLAGNTVLYKPSEEAPAVAEFIMQCWHESGLPPGIINCLQGDSEVGQLLLKQPIQGVYFTGSYATGLRIHQEFSDKPEVILALEMGGNNPLVIDVVEDVEAAVYNTLLSAFITSGQRCTCARRLIIPNTPWGDNFLQKLLRACAAIQVGSYDNEPPPFMGPVISYNQALKHLKAQEALCELGGKPLLPMKLLKDNTGFLSPGILDMSLVASPPDEEIFAPLIQLYRYDAFEEALKLANTTRYGLVAGLISDNIKHYQDFYHRVKAGLINWNKPTTGAASQLPFGGVGLSGNHRPSAYFAADYCAYPVASMEQSQLAPVTQLLPGLSLG